MKFLSRLKNSKTAEYLLLGIISLAVIAVLAVSFVKTDDAENTTSDETVLYVRELEKRMESALSQVKGAGNVAVVITVGSGNYYLLVNYAAQSVSSSISFAQAESITTNTLTKSGFTVNLNISIRVNSCSAGTTIGTVPINYRPASAKSYSTVWRVQSGTSSSTTNANITFNTNGSIVSDTDSTGSGSDGGGGKWGSYSITWYTQIVISGSWSTR